MVEQRVYLILSERGQYTDYEYRLHSIWDSREKAEAEVARLEETLHQGGVGSYSRWHFDIIERSVNVGQEFGDGY